VLECQPWIVWECVRRSVAACPAANPPPIFREFLALFTPSRLHLNPHHFASHPKASKGAAGSWLGFTKDYFLQRDALVAVLLLVDATIPPQPLDLECADWLAESEVRDGGVRGVVGVHRVWG
jgi:hypothetical protein